MVKEVIDGLKLVADGIKSVNTIAEAVKSGRGYLTAKHPQADKDVRAMVEELGKSVFVIKEASAVVTNFRFAVTADAHGGELARFNDYFIHSKGQQQHLQERIADLRTHCSKVRERGQKISGQATAAGFAKIFAMLGLNSPEREKKLGELLDRLAYEDFATARSAEQMLACLKAALQDVQDALGENGVMHAENVPAAAALLRQYGVEFEKMEEESARLVGLVRELAEKAS